MPPGEAVLAAAGSRPIPLVRMSEYTDRIAELSRRVDNAKEYL
jgi:hypothetical protein